MLVIAAALLLEAAASSTPTPQPLRVQTQWVYDRFADSWRPPRRVELDRVSPLIVWAPLAGELLDGVSTLWAVELQRRRFGGDLRWPRGEMNPLLRPLAHDKPALFMAAKAAAGAVKVLRVRRTERRHGPDRARREALVWTGMSLGVAATNVGPCVVATVSW